MEVMMDFSKALDNKDLLQAAYDLDNEMAEVCLEAGINVNYRDDRGSTALHYLAEGAKIKSGDPFIVKRKGTALLDSLMSYRPDLNIPDQQGITCLHIACANNLFWLVHQLLQHGADPTIKDGLTGETPVEMFYHGILKGRKYPNSSDLHSATTMCRPTLVLNSPSPIITSLHYAHVFKKIAERCDGKAKMKYSIFVSVAFASGMTKVYNTGAGGGNMTSLNALWINNSTSTDEFTGISVTFLNLQWAVFGLQGHNIFLSSYLPTHILCKVLLAMFLLTNLVVVSLLIVRLVSSVTTTQKEKTQLQRTHARARFILEYQDIKDLPVPFNIFHFVWLGLKALILRCKRSCPRVTCTCSATICRRWCNKCKVEKAKTAWSSYFGEGNIFQADKADVSGIMQQMVANYQSTLQSHKSVEEIDIAVDTHLQAAEEEIKGLKKEVEDVFTGLQSNKAALETNLETLQAQIN